MDNDEFYRHAKALPRPHTAATQRARRSEINRRSMEARRRAWTALANLHPDEWNRLHDAARREVDAERGPLPGDET